jgi:ethanolamine transporter EutH
MIEEIKQWTEDLTIGKKVEYVVTTAGMIYIAYHLYHFFQVFRKALENVGEMGLEEVAVLSLTANVAIFSFIMIYIGVRVAPFMGYMVGYAVDLYFDNFEEVEEEE